MTDHLSHTTNSPEAKSPATADNQIGIDFDWTAPPQANGRVSFQVRIRRGRQQSYVEFELDLAGLSAGELQRLGAFIIRRQLQLTTGYEMGRTLTWLLNCSLRQQQPELSAEIRAEKVRELLLFH